jgi:hypothetical protein
MIDFLKRNYNKIFGKTNGSLHNLFGQFIKKADKDNNLPNLYQKYVKSFQVNVKNEINNSESVNDVNLIVSDFVKYFYFSLSYVVDRLQNDEFNMESIFDKSRDKNLKILMTYPVDKFSNAVSEYVGQYVIPNIKKDSNIDDTIEDTSERIKYNVKKIFEATEEEKLADYKKSATKWVNSIFDLIKYKYQLINQLSNNNIDMNSIVSNMNGTDNDNAKKMIINKVINLDKMDLEKLSKFLGLTEDEIGKL